jgi:hypothetical protein
VAARAEPASTTSSGTTADVSKYAITCADQRRDRKPCPLT